MSTPYRGLLWWLLAAVVLLGSTASSSPSRYLFVWAMEVRHPDAAMAGMQQTGKDFLAVFDVAPDASPFGKLVATLPVGNGAKMAHHTNYALPSNGVLYANDWLAGRTYAIDLRDPVHPRLLFTIGRAGRYMYPHSFVYLSNGNTLATFQYAGGFNRGPGGLVEFDPHGHVVASGSAAAPSTDKNVRPYSMAVVEKLDRVVSSSADMMGAQSSRVVQIWRLSDLKLLQTLILPKDRHDYWFADPPADSNEPRLLADGATVIVPTVNCGLYAIRNLASANATIAHVYDFGYRYCEVPVVAGNYFIQAMQSAETIVSLDMSDPLHPREVSRIALDHDEHPHWLALEPGGDRIVITGAGALQTRVRFATVNRATGKLSLEAESIDFTRAWPDGWNGSAIPHGAVFSN